MENNVVVLNDELGTMTLGFLKMGFNVVSTYVTEKQKKFANIILEKMLFYQTL